MRERAALRTNTMAVLYDLLHAHGISVDSPAWAGTDKRAAVDGCRVYLPALANGSNLFNTDDATRIGQAIDSVTA